MATIDLTADNFETVVSDNDIVIVDFWAAWCGPCKNFAPTFEAASEAHPDIVFGKLNTEEAQEIAGHFGIRSIPTLMIFREKVILFTQAGALPAPALDGLIEQVRQVDMATVHAELAAQQEKQTQP